MAYNRSMWNWVYDISDKMRQRSGEMIGMITKELERWQIKCQGPRSIDTK